MTEKRYKVHNENFGISFTNGKLLTWGESLVKAWPKGLEEECEELDCFGDVRCAVSVKHSDRTLVHVTSENVDTESYEWPSLLEDKNYTLFRFTCDIGCIASLESQAIAGAGDFKIKHKNTETDKETILEGHEAPILSVALDPRRELAASSSCDGFFKIWDLSSSQSIFEQKLFTRCSDIEHAKCPATVEFQPDSGELIAVLVEKGAQIFNRSDRTLLHEISDAKETTKTLAWSKCGQVLAIAETTTVSFYDSNSFAKIHEIETEDNSPISSLCFTDKQVLIGESSGFLMAVPISDFISTEMKRKSPAAAMKMASESSIAISERSESGDRERNRFFDDEADDEDGEDDVDDLEALWEEDARSDAENDDGNDAAPNMDFDDDSNNAISLNAIKNSVPLEKPKDDSDAEDEADGPAAPFYDGLQPSKLQKAFQPGETPSYNATRYLCWNATGVIKGVVDEQRGISSIIVDFHDSSLHHSIQIANQNDFVLGDLSERAIVLASKGESEGIENKNSIVKVMNFKSWWDKNREWQIELPRKEIAECVCTSEDAVAVATSQRYLRIFSHGGAQLRLISIPGQIVTIAANLEQLFYVYHRGRGFEGEQYMACGLITIKKSFKKKRQPLPVPTEICLSSGARLSWAGFTDEGTPAIYDSRGVVKIVNWITNQWMPVANMTTIKKNFKTVDWWYVISVNEGNKEIAAVHCQNSTYPETHPRPEVQTLRMNMPLVNPKTDIAVQEADLIMNENVTGTIYSLQSRGYKSDETMEELVQKQITKGILKLLLGAIIQDADDRGYEICKMLENPAQIQMAVRLANNKGRVKLAQKLNQLARERSGLDSSDEDDEINQVIDRTNRTAIRSESNMSVGSSRSSVSARSEDLFSRPSAASSRQAEREKAAEQLVRRRAHNPFAQKTGGENKENETKVKLDELPKMEVHRSKPKTSREKFANFRNKQKKSTAAAKSTKVQGKINFGKRKDAPAELPVTKKQKIASSVPSVSANTSGSAVKASVNMDDFAAGSDSD